MLDMCIGILLFGILCLGIGLFFVKDKLGYSIGLLIGIAMAIGCACHMWWALNRALDLGEDDAQKLITTYSIFRYGVIVIVMGLVMISGFANPLASFLGIMGLKVAAYLQPLIHKATRRFYEEQKE